MNQLGLELMEEEKYCLRKATPFFGQKWKVIRMLTVCVWILSTGRCAEGNQAACAVPDFSPGCSNAQAFRFSICCNHYVNMIILIGA